MNDEQLTSFKLIRVGLLCLYGINQTERHAFQATVTPSRLCAGSGKWLKKNPCMEKSWNLKDVESMEKSWYFVMRCVILDVISSHCFSRLLRSPDKCR